jgi:predicted ATPase/DNA-binding XRE family transcriptional regulator
LALAASSSQSGARTRQISQPNSQHSAWIFATLPRVMGDEASAQFGDLLRDYRRAAGLTQEELAERAGVSPRSISEMERGGQHVPRRDTVELLARALELQGAERQAFAALIDARRRQSANPQPDAPLERQPHNLPRVLTSFVGRERELEELASLLATSPLLTLVGAGGVGKTRLAQELVREQASSYLDGGWLVELAGLTEASLLPGAVAAAVGLPDIQASNPTGALTEYLRSRHLLLVLDNCEHLVDACAELVAHLLRVCRGLHVLASSREPLGISGEVIRRVLPLAVPDLQQPLSADQLTHNPAVRLFLERARAVSPSLTLSPHNAQAIARICNGVAGIPLAIELAAARTRLLSVDQLADRLDQDAGILAGTNRVSLPQHRTMRATLDWSHAFLGEEEQALLRRLSVFAGGWSLALAEDVCSGTDLERESILDLLAQLVDRSLVLVDASETVARFRLLEPVRQYAAERLEASGESAIFRARHAATLLDLVSTEQAGAPGPDEVGSLDRVELEHDNVRAALRWTLSQDQGLDALRCSAALFRFWERRGHFQEGCAWLERALRSAPAASKTPERGWALNALAFLYWRGGDTERARPAAEEALVVAQASGAGRDVAQALLNLGMIAYVRNAPSLALPYLEDSVAAARGGGNVPQLSLALTFLGRTRLWLEGPFDVRARLVLEESLALARSAQSLYVTGHALATLGDLVWGQGDTQRAAELWREATLVRASLTDRRGIAGCLERLALVLAASDRFLAAAWLFGAAEAQHRLLGIALRHDEEIDHEHLLAVTQRSLGKDFAEAYAAGQASASDEAVARAIGDTRELGSGAVDRGVPRLEHAAGVVFPHPRM